jgi:hypothetical protein
VTFVADPAAAVLIAMVDYLLTLPPSSLTM